MRANSPRKMGSGQLWLSQVTQHFHEGSSWGQVSPLVSVEVPQHGRLGGWGAGSLEIL